MIQKEKSKITRDNLNNLAFQVMRLTMRNDLINDDFKEILVATHEIHFDKDDSEVRNKVFDLIEENNEILIWQKDREIGTLGAEYKFCCIEVIKDIDDLGEMGDVVYYFGKENDLTDQEKDLLINLSRGKEIIYK